ncbi:MAG: aminoacyl-tRNA hydrolase [Selenomonadaceae bacterium]|nr:aminoacyl-tRNA hydrolase [Selenomonadaceae bacterium]
MKIIVGLGNPGSEYAKTKHNVGFMLIDAIANEISASNWREDFRALISDAFVDGEKVFLVKPLTFMNLSGEAVRPIMDYYKLTPDDLIVAHDDMDLQTGVIRLRPKGSGGGHHGVESIIQHLGGNENFARIRIGVGRPPFNESLISHSDSPYAVMSKVNRHVLSPFNEEDSIKIKEAINCLVPAALCIVREGINKAMNKFNPKKKKKKANDIE